MRKKLWFGVLAVTLIGVAAGAHVLSGLNAQDAAKKNADTKKGDDWFETLKKALEAKKDAPIPPPSSGFGSDRTVPPPAVDVGVAIGDKPVPVVVPPPQLPKDEKSVIPPPTPLVPLAPMPGTEKKGSGGLELPPPALALPPKTNEQVKPADKKNAPEDLLGTFSGPGTLNGIDAPKPVDKKDASPVKPLLPITSEPGPIAPPTAVKPEAKSSQPPLPQPKDPLPLKPIEPAAIPPQVKPQTPPTVQIAPNPPISEQVAKMKGCPWSLHVDIVDGQTIMTATVNKKHDFKIVCKSVDLQTGKNMLKATGKVQISGDMLTGNCEHLSIPLMEDRLVMEGGASVSIQKMSTNVSNEMVASFELKGATLDLRISEIVPAKLVQQASWQPTPVSRDTKGDNRTIVRSTNDQRHWTPYGTLRRGKNAGEPTWFLEDKSGQPIRFRTYRFAEDSSRTASDLGSSKEFANYPVLLLGAREGGTLEQFEGRTISVHGVISQVNGQSMMRVTHIALP